jgi:hypothetical protein
MLLTLLFLRQAEATVRKSSISTLPPPAMSAEGSLGTSKGGIQQIPRLRSLPLAALGMTLSWVFNSFDNK